MAISFIVEDGSGLSTATSYLPVADADQYHENHGNSDWTGTDAAKQAALINATQYLDAHYQWATGSKASKAQALGWPRLNAYDADDFAFDATEIPVAVKNATAYLARESLIGTDLQPNESRRTASETVVGAVAVTYEPGQSLAPRFSLVDNMLSGLINTGVQGAVSRA